MIITLKTEFIGEMTQWEMALAMLGNPEDDFDFVQYRDEDGLYCIEVEEELAVNAGIDRVTITFKTAKEYRNAIAKLEELDIWYYVSFDDPDKQFPILRLTTFRTYALAAGLDVKPDKEKV